MACTDCAILPLGEAHHEEEAEVEIRDDENTAAGEGGAAGEVIVEEE